MSSRRGSANVLLVYVASMATLLAPGIVMGKPLATHVTAQAAQAWSSMSTDAALEAWQVRPY